MLCLSVHNSLVGSQPFLGRVLVLTSKSIGYESKEVITRTCFKSCEVPLSFQRELLYNNPYKCATYCKDTHTS